MMENVGRKMQKCEKWRALIEIDELINERKLCKCKTNQRRSKKPLNGVQSLDPTVG